MSAAFETSSKDLKDLIFFRIAVYSLAFATPLLRNLTQALAIIVLISGIYLWIRSRTRRRLPRWESLFLFVFIVLYFLSGFINDFKVAQPLLGKIWAPLCLFPIVAFSDRLSKKLIAELFLWATVIASAIGIVRFYIYDLDRAASLAGGYTTLAIFEASMLPLGLLFFWQENGKRRWLYLAAMVVMGLGLFLTETRAGWLAAIMGLIICGYYFNKKMTLAAIVIALALIAILPQTRTIIEKRMETNKPGGITSGRAVLWSYSLSPLSRLPLFGYGPGSFTKLMPPEVLIKTGDLEIKSWHSTPLEILLEAGPLALLSFLAFSALCLFRSWKSYYLAPRRISLELGLFTALIVVYLTGLSTNIFRDLMLTSFLVLLWSMILSPGNKEMDIPQLSE